MRARQLASAFALAAVVFTPAFMSACAPMHVQSFTERGNRLNTARTYRWADDRARATGDPRLDSNPFFERRLIDAANQQLAARGFERTQGDADLVLHYYASVSQRLDISDVDRMLGYCEGCQSQSLYDAGTILFDLVDAKTNKLLWRAWAERSIDGMIDDQKWLEEHIDAAVARIVATLPHRS